MQRGGGKTTRTLLSEKIKGEPRAIQLNEINVDCNKWTIIIDSSRNQHTI